MWHPIEGSAGQAWSAVNVNDVDLLIASVDGRWWCVEDRCSHAGCAFSTDGDLDGSTLVCDCHGSEFELTTGAVLVPPAVQPLRTYPTRLTRDGLEVQL